MLFPVGRIPGKRESLGTSATGKRPGLVGQGRHRVELREFKLHTRVMAESLRLFEVTERVAE